MPDRCCVPRCKDNYDNGPKVHVFKFPSDEALKQKWLYAIRRDNFVPTRNNKVSICRKSAWQTWFHSENHYCCFCFRFFVRLENGSWRIRFCLWVVKQVVIIRFTFLLRNDLNFSAWWCIPLTWKANVRIITNISYPNLTVYARWCTPVISFKSSKTVARSYPFTNAKLPRLFVGTKRIAQAEFKRKINFKRTIQFIKRIDAEYRHDWEQQEEYDFCLTLEDVKHSVQIEKQGQVLDSDTTNNLNFCIIQYTSNAGASVDKCLAIDENLMLTCCMRSVNLSSLDKFQFPLKVNSLRTIEEVRDVLTNMQIPSCTNCSDSQFILILKLVLSLLIPLTSVNFKFHRVIWFICEQLRLMTQSVYCYFYDFLVFASVFYNTAPNAYRFLRTSGNCILPCLNTIRKITLSKTMSPLIEQHESTCFCYVKEKVKILQPNDKTVVLLVDEIHLQQCFDYKGGSVVGTASNSNEAAKSAFAFMISSIVSKYKDVVHVLPTCKINAKDLFALIRRTIRGLEEAGFRVISVITDNNAISRKAMLFFAEPHKLSFVYLHPCDVSRLLFFLFDSVHILKCVRNNWVNQKSTGKCMMYTSVKSEKVQVDNCDITRFELIKPVIIAQASNQKLIHLSIYISWNVTQLWDMPTNCLWERWTLLLLRGKMLIWPCVYLTISSI